MEYKHTCCTCKAHEDEVKSEHHFKGLYLPPLKDSSRQVSHFYKDERLTQDTFWKRIEAGRDADCESPMSSFLCLK